MHPSIKLCPAYGRVSNIYCIIRSKRKSDEIEKPEDPILRTCSDCYPFRASWSTKSLCAGGITYIGVGGGPGPHAQHHIWDCYHQGYHRSEAIGV
jgi:hypothetical protein